MARATCRSGAGGGGASAAEHYVDVPYDQEVYIRLQVISILDYLNRVQRSRGWFVQLLSVRACQQCNANRSKL